MAYRIVTDSASNLIEEMIDEFGLEVLPLTFMVDGVEHRSYLKGAKTDLKQFYTCKRPKTRCAPFSNRETMSSIWASRALFPEPTRQRLFS